MKKLTFPLLAICTVFVLTISSCTKERMALDLLYGTWKLDSQLDNDGVPVTQVAGINRETLVTFYRCSDKENESCSGTSKVTITNTNVSPPDVNIIANTITYRVFQKSQLILNGDYYEVDQLKKKSLVIHPVEEPLATETYSKQ